MTDIIEQYQAAFTAFFRKPPPTITTYGRGYHITFDDGEKKYLKPFEMRKLVKSFIDWHEWSENV